MNNIPMYIWYGNKEMAVLGEGFSYTKSNLLHCNTACEPIACYLEPGNLEHAKSTFDVLDEHGIIMGTIYYFQQGFKCIKCREELQRVWAKFYCSITAYKKNNPYKFCYCRKVNESPIIKWDEKLIGIILKYDKNQKGIKDNEA